MEFKEWVQTEAVWRGHELERLPVELGRNVVVVLEPGLGVNDVLDTDQTQFAAAHRLVDQSFGGFFFDLSIPYQRSVDVMDAHGAVVRAGDAAKGRSVPRGSGVVDIKEHPSGVANVFDQLGRRMALMAVVLCGKRNNSRRG